MNNKVVAVSGGFDPLHVGHLELFKKAKNFGNVLIVIINRDHFLRKKKGYVFMPLNERSKIVKHIDIVDFIVRSVDEDMTVCDTLKLIHQSVDVFANGGDRKREEIPETKTCEKYGIEIVDGLGDKIKSSSQLVRSVIRQRNGRVRS